MTQAAYGLRFAGMSPTPWLAAAGVEHWPEVMIRYSDREPGPPGIDVARREVQVARGAPVDVVVHPGLAWAGLAFALAAGRDAVHAGAVSGPGGTWAVIGTKETGKSTLLAAAAEAGIDVVADDVLVIDGDGVLSGPRCVDLRHPPDVHPSTPVDRAGGRWRVTLPPTAPRRRLTGLLFLSWADQVSVAHVGASEVVARILAMQSEDRFPRRPQTVMGLAALPARELRRPRDLEAIGESVAAVRNVIGGR